MKMGSILLILLILGGCSKKEIEKSALDFGVNDPTDPTDNGTDTDGGDDSTGPGGEGDNTPPGSPYTTPVTMQFTWDTPTKREDDSALPLSEISGYMFYVGFKENEWQPGFLIANNEATSYNFEIDADDNYYFAISTVDSDNIEGQKSSGFIKIACVEAVCTVTNLPVKPPSSILDSSGNNSSTSPDPAEEASASQTTLGTPAITKITAIETCPLFPAKNLRNLKINYNAKNVRVTHQGGYKPKVIQCNWKRHHDEESKKKHLIGLSQLNLHLPIFRNGNAFVANKKLYIPLHQ